MCQLADQPREMSLQKSIKKGKRQVQVGDMIMVRDYRGTSYPAWTAAVMEKQIARTVYLCRLNTGQLWKRHINQIKKTECNANKNQMLQRPVSVSILPQLAETQSQCSSKMDDRDYFVNLPIKCPPVLSSPGNAVSSIDNAQPAQGSSSCLVICTLTLQIRQQKGLCWAVVTTR